MKKRIKGFEESYKISENGKVYSLDRVIKLSDGRTKTIKGKEIKWQVSNRGYARVQLSTPELGRKKYSVHRLVAEHFVDGYSEIKGRIIVNHKDGNKLNNNKENLEWVTNSENQIHAIKEKLRKVKFSDAEIRFIRNFEGTNKELCDTIGITQSEVCHIKSRKIYSRVKD